MSNANNLMAVERVCPVLDMFYRLPASEKEKYLLLDPVRKLLAALPAVIAQILVNGFLSGTPLKDFKDGDQVIRYFRENSDIIPELARFPGTYIMLEMMYHFRSVRWPIDTYYLESIPGGQALKNRYHAVNREAAVCISDVLRRCDSCLMLDFGSGPGRNGIDICNMNPGFKNRLSIDCIDIDPDAVAKGVALADFYNLSNVNFVSQSMTKLNGRYNRNVDVGLLIGVLCGMTYPEKVCLLKKIRPYFRSGGKLIAATLLDEMPRQDLFCSYTLRETAGWVLMHPPLGNLKTAFEEAGYEYERYFQDAPTNLYEIGVGVVP